jgi:hypothetical protein
MHPTHPHAQTAVFLAAVNPTLRRYVAHELRSTGTPRSLYTLARVLRAAQMMDEIEAMHRPTFAKAA